jgi:L-ascorbate metabolism protein UlaG (beta-lactamase superfamily)
MKIKWYGHSAFKLISDKGIKIIIDPYESGAYNGALSYGKITDTANIVLTSHNHPDHNYIKDIRGKYEHISKAGDYEIQNVKIKALPSFHDNSSGKERGQNLIFVIAADNLILVHTGDIGHELDSDLFEKIGKVDILLLPVGGFFTIDAEQAAKMMNTFQPSVTIPMHYKTDKCGFPITSVEEFTKNKNNVRVLKESEIEIKKDALPEKPEIIVLQHFS